MDWIQLAQSCEYWWARVALAIFHKKAGNILIICATLRLSRRTVKLLEAIDQCLVFLSFYTIITIGMIVVLAYRKLES